MIVDNKAGADGAIAGAEVVKAAPDGYTLLMATNSPMAVVPAMKKVPPYDPVADFTPITDIGRYTFFLYVNAEQPIKTFKELVAYAKANPGKLNYATGNTTGIVSFAQMNSLAGIDMTHVPYKGEPQAVTDIIAGRVQLLWATPTTGLAHLKDGKLRALATNLKARSSLLPDVPTMAEVGIPQYSVVSWAALYGAGEAAARHPAAPEQGVPRRDEAPGRDRADGQAGLSDEPVHAGGTRRLHQVAARGLPRHPEVASACSRNERHEIRTDFLLVAWFLCPALQPLNIRTGRSA